MATVSSRRSKENFATYFPNYSSTLLESKKSSCPEIFFLQEEQKPSNAEGYLYPLKSSIVFIHKPVLYIRHSELRFVEFSRIGQGSSGLSRSFDVTLTKLADDSKVTFMSIDKEEQACLIAYFKAANVKMRTVDLETNIHEDLGSEDEEPSQ